MKILALLFVLFVSTESHLHRPYKKPTSKSSTTIVHYLTKGPHHYQISHVALKNLLIEYNEPWIAKSTWNDNYNTTGWSVLEIETDPNAKDEEQAYAAGLLEASLTKDLISLHLINTVGDFCRDPNDKTCIKLFEFLEENFKWMESQIVEYENDPYWHQVNLSLAQLHGLYNGFIGNMDFTMEKGRLLKLIKARDQTLMDLIVLQLNGDLGEILLALSSQIDRFYAGSCSALIKVLYNDLLVSHSTWGPYEVLPNNQDVFTSHVTWTEYESMLRVLKSYNFHYHASDKDQTPIPVQSMSFSSYPGILLSIDDFYITDQNMTIIETTIGNSNANLWKYTTPQTNLYWIRIQVANRLATSGKDWSQFFELYNSGTYNNEWMIVDYKKFIPNEPLQDGLFTVLEQIPGNIVWQDKTDVLRKQSYWSSYNLPSYPFIYNLSGVYESYEQYGDFFSYTNAPRAQIFKRDQSKVVDLDSMMHLMRYNNYTQDPFSQCNCNPPYSGENAIAARSDLNPSNGTYPFDALGHRDHGATDMKLTNFKMSLTRDFIAISGPTYVIGDKKIPFDWSTADFGPTTNHFGHPEGPWQFEPYLTKWNF